MEQDLTQMFVGYIAAMTTFTFIVVVYIATKMK